MDALPDDARTTRDDSDDESNGWVDEASRGCTDWTNERNVRLFARTCDA